MSEADLDFPLRRAHVGRAMADTRNSDRKDRLSAALRENLKRRKQQLRDRATQAGKCREGDAAPAPTEADTTGRADGNDRQ